MGGYVTAFGTCVQCKQPFSFNPHKVPSVRIDGAREPVCRNCMDRLIAKEEAAGITPKRYLPDAYDPMPEEEL